MSRSLRKKSGRKKHRSHTHTQWLYEYLLIESIKKRCKKNKKIVYVQLTCFSGGNRRINHIDLSLQLFDVILQSRGLFWYRRHSLSLLSTIVYYCVVLYNLSHSLFSLSLFLSHTLTLDKIFFKTWTFEVSYTVWSVSRISYHQLPITHTHTHIKKPAVTHTHTHHPKLPSFFVSLSLTESDDYYTTKKPTTIHILIHTLPTLNRIL